MHLQLHLLTLTNPVFPYKLLLAKSALFFQLVFSPLWTNAPSKTLKKEITKKEKKREKKGEKEKKMKEKRKKEKCQVTSISKTFL